MMQTTYKAGFNLNSTSPLFLVSDVQKDWVSNMCEQEFIRTFNCFGRTLFVVESQYQRISLGVEA